MMIPTATYRIQFRNGMTFDRASGLVRYLKRLGISHLYASPIFTATTGSTHGYDVTDANEIDPAIGGRDGFERMVKALKAEGFGLILDIVPNHMAASLENPWWRDVVENGENSRYARHFDIDWTRRLTLPFLGDTFEKVLEAEEISVKADPKTGKPALAYYDTFYPLASASYAGRETEVLKITDRAAIARLHDQQPYRLTSWRDAPRELSYRRFFEITGLAGVRVEDGAVFDDTHRLILELVRDGMVDGLRVDHVDGLADPKGYLDRLRHEAGPDCYITVEKILGEGEQIPADWPVSGTTGYEFIAAVSDALVDGRKLNELRRAYERITGQPVDMQAELRAAKLLMADNNFAGEVSTLLNIATQIRPTGDRRSALSEAAVKSALRELLVTFPVYRTYGTQEGMPPKGREMLAKVLAKVRNGPNPPDDAALAFVERILIGDVEQAAASSASIFRTRFQQLTGPLMAKSVEDTLFFRQHMALALNEVGAEPLPRPFSLDRFHAEMQTRLERQPDALSGTSTHDTKRGEDARARLYTITEAPDLWADAVDRWRRINSQAVRALDDGPAPEPAVEWMLYQALAGAWPNDLHTEEAAGLKALETRFLGYVEKALREAKLRTNWGAPNEIYEKAVQEYARTLLSPSNQAFLTDFTDTLRPFIRAGLVNSVTQTIIKLTAPGVPDIYQGSEGLDLSLVDPDNRREPDFGGLQQRLTEREKLASTEEGEWQSGRLKQHVIATLLRVRQEAPTLFRRGEYLPLGASGKRADNVIAFARADMDDAFIVIAPRLVFSALHAGLAPSRSERWAETEITLPERLGHRRYRDVCTGKVVDPKDRIAVNLVFADHPFALLLAE
ncbi:(1-_4)-alpha-D-glucan 1-alpha-D-glucosylmutase [Neorhizobium galegae bv. officinalis bv. officinalis str. HAMBI 1141]|uniref:(1->4)-alpha-D-glucan 1-alpha-D-glucosylmutase n=1 Tax=Neorhizobium galegae bv. officinalis bv. officinalis str. HAMBI 1141 TaxID=1028801 RepID=A0A068TAS5_NEOGA|nr:malto-oligosyltrehalose synthase [Neorhizobium galegae]CDN55166.1 (1->4)-alpha-D-glucan 1-alpha-D-glucosylmutase [Neorhizobium galegae bv. officinalis bv. officinalis str. HAMBI 1141]